MHTYNVDFFVSEGVCSSELLEDGNNGTKGAADHKSSLKFGNGSECSQTSCAQAQLSTQAGYICVHDRAE